MPLKVMQQTNGQLMVTIPKQLGIALSILKGDQVEWRINKVGFLELRKIENGKD